MEGVVSLTLDDMDRLDGLCDGLGKSRDEVISGALYFVEQSLLYDPVLEVTPNDSRE